MVLMPGEFQRHGAFQLAINKCAKIREPIGSFLRVPHLLRSKGWDLTQSGFPQVLRGFCNLKLETRNSKPVFILLTC